ncbi:hypothetical protein GLS40_12645 [Pseudooceanicola sp. 216_PA32_1]|uniref:Lipoprotein n=1 Tax=Pseudooceanicola pacificus TaxID=2676438 RepID=A0A844W7P6_9RHOB|nr:hypothetical protein [Pseudooceanicola pacificus]MWB78881.1 hypothetical protein [Pseudooceanicola pacificus]
MKASSALPRLCAAVCVLALAAGAGCSRNNRVLVNNNAFDGVYFRASLTADKENPQRFSVLVRNAARTLKGAKEAGRYEATKYCAKYYGWSEVDWAIGPETPDAQLRLNEDGDLILNGECTGWV